MSCYLLIPREGPRITPNQVLTVTWGIHFKKLASYSDYSQKNENENSNEYNDTRFFNECVGDTHRLSFPEELELNLCELLFLLDWGLRRRLGYHSDLYFRLWLW